MDRHAGTITIDINTWHELFRVDVQGQYPATNIIIKRSSHGFVNRRSTDGGDSEFTECIGAYVTPRPKAASHAGGIQGARQLVHALVPFQRVDPTRHLVDACSGTVPCARTPQGSRSIRYQNEHRWRPWIRVLSPQTGCFVGQRFITNRMQPIKTFQGPIRIHQRNRFVHFELSVFR